MIHGRDLLFAISATLTLWPSTAQAQLETFEQATRELVDASRQTKPSRSVEIHTAANRMGAALAEWDRRVAALQAQSNAELAGTPRDFSTLYYLAYAHEGDGGLDAALERIRQALKLAPQSAEANALAGKILTKQDRPGEALAYLEKAVKSDPADPNKRYLLARAYQSLGRREEADREFAEVHRLKGDQFKSDQARTPRP